MMDFDYSVFLNNINVTRGPNGPLFNGNWSLYSALAILLPRWNNWPFHLKMALVAELLNEMEISFDVTGPSSSAV